MMSPPGEPSRARGLLAIAALVNVLGCGGAHRRGSGETSKRWILLSVESGRISETLSSGGTWDRDGTAAREERRSRSGEALGSVLALADPTVGAIVSALSVLSSGDAASADAPPEYPDPVLVLTYHRAGASTTTRSTVEFDSVRPAWGYRTYVDLDELAAEGIDIDVRDFDDRNSPRIGGARFSKRDLEKAITTPPREVVRADHELEELRIRFSPVTGDTETPAWSHRELQLRDGLTSSGVSVALNALVTVKARGNGRVADGGLLSCARRGRVTPAGLPGDECREHNLRHDTTREAPHGSALALIGADDQVQAVSLVAGENPEPCVQFLSPASGEIVFGVNDRDRSNDSGTFEFEMSVTAPPEDTDWLAGGPASCPE